MSIFPAVLVITSAIVEKASMAVIEFDRGKEIVGIIMYMSSLVDFHTSNFLCFKTSVDEIVRTKIVFSQQKIKMFIRFQILKTNPQDLISICSFQLLSYGEQCVGFWLKAQENFSNNFKKIAQGVGLVVKRKM
jgi:hypothetical protein